MGPVVLETQVDCTQDICALEVLGRVQMGMAQVSRGCGPKANEQVA